jgi:PP-loop superfamily ATP-utilizing enzyme
MINKAFISPKFMQKTKMTRFSSKKFYEQTGTKATEIHSHHCLYGDTTFPQLDDLIKHSRGNHPYHCYYCKTATFVLFEEAIKHSTKNHGSLMVKVKYLELNPFSGHYGILAMSSYIN